jgi:hypothetical protein
MNNYRLIYVRLLINRTIHRAVKVLLQKGILLSNERSYRLNHNYGWKGDMRKFQLVKNRSEVKSWVRGNLAMLFS